MPLALIPVLLSATLAARSPALPAPTQTQTQTQTQSLPSPSEETRSDLAAFLGGPVQTPITPPTTPPPVAAALGPVPIPTAPLATATPEGAPPQPAEPRPGEPASGPEISVSSVTPGVPSDDGRLLGTIVRLELLSASLQSTLGGRSSQLVVDVDCAGQRLRSRDVMIYAGPHGTGKVTPYAVKARWLDFGGGAYIADVARQICSTRTGRTSAREPSPAATGPATTGPSIPDPNAATARSRGDTAASVSRRPPTRAPDTVPPAPQPPPRGHIYQVQFVSSTSRAEVDFDERKIRAALGAAAGRLNFGVDRAELGGVIHFWGRAGPLTGPAAKTVCRQIEELKLTCLVILSAQGPGK